MDSISTGINNLINIMLGLGLGVTILFVMYSGYVYITAGGSPRQMEKAKSSLVNALGGFALILLARVITTALQNALGH